jgi:hypothetical protein
MRDQLRQHAVHRIWMDERHLETVQAEARLAVDKLYTGTVEPVELGAKIIDLVGDVVHSRPAADEEPSHRRVLLERGEQLDPASSAPCDAIVSRASTLAPNSLSYVDTASSRSCTATPMWWMPPSATLRC